MEFIGAETVIRPIKLRGFAASAVFDDGLLLDESETPLRKRSDCETDNFDFGPSVAPVPFGLVACDREDWVELSLPWGRPVAWVSASCSASSGRVEELDVGAASSVFAALAFDRVPEKDVGPRSGFAAVPEKSLIGLAEEVDIEIVSIMRETALRGRWSVCMSHAKPPEAVADKSSAPNSQAIKRMQRC